MLFQQNLIRLYYFIWCLTPTLVVPFYRHNYFFPRRMISSKVLHSLSIARNSNEDPSSSFQEEIQVYSTIGCKFCRLAKATLDNLQLPYRTIDISEPISSTMGSKDGDTMLSRYYHARNNTVPQIYFASTHIGGCSDLLSLLDIKPIRTILQETGLDYLSNSVTPSSTSPSLKQCSKVSAEDVIKLYPKAGEPLNHFYPTPNMTLPSSLLTLSQELQRSILSLTDTFVTSDGKQVDYVQMRSSVAFQQYVQLASLLRRYPLSSYRSTMSIAERKAFFINLYNVMVLHANTLYPQPTSPSERQDYFSGKTGIVYALGSHAEDSGQSLQSPSFSLDDIEHGILRCNRPKTHSSDKQGTYFDHDEDSSHKMSLSLPPSAFDPRIHFLLNCGAKACPPIRILSAENLETAMTLATQSFLADTIDMDIQLVTTNDDDDAAGTNMKETIVTMHLPRLFYWFAHDFGVTVHDQLEWILRQFTTNISNNRDDTDMDIPHYHIVLSVFLKKVQETFSDHQVLIHSINNDHHIWKSLSELSPVLSAISPLEPIVYRFPFPVEVNNDIGAKSRMILILEYDVYDWDRNTTV